MNRQALIKLATLRLAINHVLRSRLMQKEAGPWGTAPSHPTANMGMDRQRFFKNNKSTGPRIPLSIGIPSTGFYYKTDNINPFYYSPEELEARRVGQNYQDYKNNLLPHLNGEYTDPDSLLRCDPNRKHYDENKDFLEIWRSRARNEKLNDTDLDTYKNLEREFGRMYPSKDLPSEDTDE